MKISTQLLISSQRSRWLRAAVVVAAIRAPHPLAAVPGRYARLDEDHARGVAGNHDVADDGTIGPG